LTAQPCRNMQQPKTQEERREEGYLCYYLEPTISIIHKYRQIRKFGHLIFPLTQGDGVKHNTGKCTRFWGGRLRGERKRQKVRGAGRVHSSEKEISHFIHHRKPSLSLCVCLCMSLSLVYLANKRHGTTHKRGFAPSEPGGSLNIGRLRAVRRATNFKKYKNPYTQSQPPVPAPATTSPHQ